MIQTEIYFYSDAPNKLHTACRLCSKAVQQGLKVWVYAVDASLVDHFDKLLWTVSPTSFIPHCRAESKLARVSPIVISNTVDCSLGKEVLLNLHGACPPSFNQFQRVIEITDISNEDKAAARKRYRFYQREGYIIHHYQIADS